MEESQKKSEISYLTKMCKNKLSKNNPFCTINENGNEIFILSNDEKGIITKYRTLYETTIDLINKIEYALNCAIENAYNINSEHYKFFVTSDDEWFAYYNIENSLFRLEALWDILAQIYNIKYNLENNIAYVYHNKIFSRKPEFYKKYWNNKPPKNVVKIINYLNEKDNTDCEGMWKGNYKYISKLRNKMAHRVSISMSSMSDLSDYTFDLKPPPTYILKRMCENFSILQDYLLEIFNELKNNI